MPKKLTTEEWIAKARDIYGDRYDYSKVNYVNSKTKVCIICPEHGEFFQQPCHHTKGHQCPKCAHIQGGVKNKEISSSTIVERIRKLRGDKYDYSKVIYTGRFENISIICKEHGEFITTPANALDSRTVEICPYCCNKSHIIDIEHFIFKARKVHGDKYDYSKVVYGRNNNDKICIVCPEHGEFWQSPSHHFRGEGCPKCGYSKLLNIQTSSGELEVMGVLSKWNISYKTQVSFPSTVNDTGHLYVDFYIEALKTVIEYHGPQHYRPISNRGGEEKFIKQQARDEELRQYCKDNDIKLIEIRYDEDVWEVLNEKLFNDNNDK